MTPDRSDHNPEPVSDDSGGDIEDAGLNDIDEYSARAALDSSGHFYRLLGKDTDGRGHYVKERDDEAEVAVIDPDQAIIEYEPDVSWGRLESYVWEHEWQELTKYGVTWLGE